MRRVNPLAKLSSVGFSFCGTNKPFLFKANTGCLTTSILVHQPRPADADKLFGDVQLKLYHSSLGAFKNSAEAKKGKLEAIETPLTSSSTRKKGLFVRGRVDVDKHVYIEQKGMQLEIQPKIEYGESCILIAPNQSGKTSLVRNTLIPSLVQRGYFPVFVDMRDVVRTYMEELTSFNQAFMIYLNRFLQTKYESYELTSLFARNSGIPEFKGQKVILFLDEVDSIAELPVLERKCFLAALSSMKENKETYCFHTYFLITNWVGGYFNQTFGSPFNIGNILHGDYFTEQEVAEFFNEYEKESSKKISSEIRNNIFKLTTGAQGQTAMLTLYYESLCGEEESIDEKYWYSSLVSEPFWEYISSHPEFKRISSILSDEIIAKSVLDWFKNQRQPTEEIENILIKSNIWKRNRKFEFEFASPIVEQYVLDNIKC